MEADKQLPADVTDSHGWLIRRYDQGHNDPVCPECYATIDLSNEAVEQPCPNGCKVKVCSHFLCPWCVYGDDPFCEEK